MSVNIQGNCADGVMTVEFLEFGGASDGRFRALIVFESAEGIVGETSCLALFGLRETLALAIEDEHGVFDERHAMRVGKFFGSVTDEVDVRTFFEYAARGLNWIAQALYAGHATCLHATAVHKQSFELISTIGGYE